MKVLLITIILLLITIVPINGEIPQPIDPNQCPSYDNPNQYTECEKVQRENSKEVKFVDAYFGEIINNTPIKKEIAPNKGIATFIVILANTGHFQLIGVRGWLTLPYGLESLDGNLIAFDTYDLPVNQGGLIYLEFPVKVKDVNIGLYNAPLYVEYFRARDQGIQFREMSIQFRVTGESKLDAYAMKPILSIGKNEIMIHVINNGSTASYSTEVNLLSNALIIFGNKTIHIGDIKPQEVIPIKLNAYVNPTLANQIVQLNIVIEYLDSYGNKNTKEVNLEFMIEGSTNNIDLVLDSDKSIINILKDEEIVLKILNKGYEEARNVEVFINTPTNIKSSLSIKGDNHYLINSIKPNEEKSVTIKVFAPESINKNVIELPIDISFLDLQGGKYNINRKLMFYAHGTINLKVSDIEVTLIGNVPNISGTLLNEGTDTALFTTIEVLGYSSQYIGDVDPNSPIPFSVPINNTKFNDISIKITYKDELRNQYEIITKEKIDFTPVEITPKKEEVNEQSNMYILAIIGAVAAISVYIIRKRRGERLDI